MTDIMKRLEPFQVADWLSLAAAPTFALMAVLAGILDSGAHQVWCSAAMHRSPLTGMVPMYALMGAFHFTPWLKLVSRWRRGEGALKARLNVSDRAKTRHRTTSISGFEAAIRGPG
jgi:hypothetical protein